jgi:hypothetical protein
MLCSEPWWESRGRETGHACQQRFSSITWLIRRTVGVLELVFWLHTHIFFGTLESGVVQNNVILRGYWQLAAG